MKLHCWRYRFIKDGNLSFKIFPERLKKVEDVWWIAIKEEKCKYNEATELSRQSYNIFWELKIVSEKQKLWTLFSKDKLGFTLVKLYKKDLNIFALQNSSAMGAAAPWSSTMMMDRISLDDMPHKGRGNILIKHELPHAVLRRPFDLSHKKYSLQFCEQKYFCWPKITSRVSFSQHQKYIQNRWPGDSKQKTISYIDWSSLVFFFSPSMPVLVDSLSSKKQNINYRTSE